MTEREQLVRVIMDNPFEDTARMVYADYCEENERSEYADYIRWNVKHRSVQGKAVRIHDSVAYDISHPFMGWFVYLFDKHLPIPDRHNDWQWDRGLLHIKTTQKDFVRLCDTGMFAHVDCCRVELTDRKPFGPTQKILAADDVIWQYGWQKASVCDHHWLPDPNSLTYRNDRVRYYHDLNFYRTEKNYGIYDPVWELLEGGCRERAQYNEKKSNSKIFDEEEKHPNRTLRALSVACCVYGIRRHDELAAAGVREETVDGEYGNN